MKTTCVAPARVIVGLALAITVAILSACSKPPACGDKQSLDLARQIFISNLSKQLGTFSQDDPDAWTQKFLAGIQITFSRIVSEGYQQDAKRQLCSAQMKVKSLGKEYEESRVEYATQLTEDTESSFTLQLQGTQHFAQALSQEGYSYYLDHRWAGEWRGTYACRGIDGKDSGPQGPFTQRVSLMVTRDKANLERTANGGGYEQLSGEFSQTKEGTQLELGGTGRNSPTDSWVTDFKGLVKGNQAWLGGEIRLPRTYPNERTALLRSCQLELTLVAAKK